MEKDSQQHDERHQGGKEEQTPNSTTSRRTDGLEINNLIFIVLMQYGGRHCHLYKVSNSAYNEKINISFSIG